MMYQMTHNRIHFNTDNFLIPHTETRTRGSHCFKFQIPKVNKDIFKFSYFPRTIEATNCFSINFHVFTNINQLNCTKIRFKFSTV